MEMAAIPATTAPTTAPTFEHLPPESDENPVKDALGEVLDMLRDALGEDVDTLEDALEKIVDTPEGPKIAPGPYSGLSIYQTLEAERKDRRHDAHHLLDTMRWRPKYSLSGAFCEYVAIEEKLKKQTVTSRVAQ
jgi:hypothetical protein